MNILNKIRNKIQLIFIDHLENILKKLPVNENHIYFLSFGGRYSDSPRYLSEEIHRQNSNVELIWSLTDPQNKIGRPDYITKVKHNSLKDIYYRSCSKVVVDNVVGVNSFYIREGDNRLKINRKIGRKKRKDQMSVSTWHGTALKRMVKDEPGSTVIGFESTLDEMYWGDDHTIDIMNGILYNEVEILKLGVPRNDILVGLRESEKDVLKQKLDLPLKKKILLFAPTFRKDDVSKSGLMQLNMIDFDLLFSTLEEKFGGEWIMVSRFHYLVDSQIDWKEIERRYDGKIMNGNQHEDMAEYLAASDILITDYSSSMFDFALKEEPVFLLCPDLEYYGNKERGFYLDIGSMPFPLAVDFDTLIRNIVSFSKETYGAQLVLMNEELGNINDGKSSERIAERVLSFL
jgi:CDP-glycerol glycerophosphotransferase